MRDFLKLTKNGIVVFVLVTGSIGYFMSWPTAEPLNWVHYLLTAAALYFMSAGSFAINQAQDAKLDALMPRTATRPIPQGKISVAQAYFLGFGFLLIGSLASILVSHRVLALSWFTVIFYNVCYTLYWKRRWAFGAVPGAIPGALPVVIGYAANSEFLLAPEIIYGFLIMFLWQMPHFWSIAIRFKDDYAQGGVPVLPVIIGVERTLYHIGLYMFAYIAVALAAPAFVHVHFFYLIVTIPFAFKCLWEFWKYWRAQGAKENWLPFFLWTNFSVIIFLLGPLIDKWWLSGT